MTTSIITPTVSPDLIITTPKQLLAAYVRLLELLGFEEPETGQVAAGCVNQLIDELRTLNGA